MTVWLPGRRLTVNYYSQGLLEVRHEVLVNDLHLLITVHVVLQLMGTLN